MAFPRLSRIASSQVAQYPVNYEKLPYPTDILVKEEQDIGKIADFIDHVIYCIINNESFTNLPEYNELEIKHRCPEDQNPNTHNVFQRASNTYKIWKKMFRKPIDREKYFQDARKENEYLQEEGEEIKSDLEIEKDYIKYTEEINEENKSIKNLFYLYYHPEIPIPSNFNIFGENFEHLTREQISHLLFDVKITGWIGHQNFLKEIPGIYEGIWIPEKECSDLYDPGREDQEIVYPISLIKKATSIYYYMILEPQFSEI